MTTIEGVEAQNSRNSPCPILRIYILGPFDIQWPQTGLLFPKERLQGRGAAPALALLQAILTRPDRFALRDWLMEQFWPGTAHRTASARLDDLASVVRSLLRPPESHAKILYFVYGKDGKGNAYRLEGYPLIWIDAEAFEWYVEQAARLDRFGHDSLSLWEEAYQLGSRGELLPHELYTDWAIPRREWLRGLYRQCVHRLVQLLREIGAYEQALLRLRCYWQQHPTDEDALRILLEMLGERERSDEAEQYYRQAREAVQEEERDLDAKTQDVMECLRARPLERERAFQQAASAAKQIHPLNLAPEHQSPEISPPFSQEIIQDIIEASKGKPELQDGVSGLPATNSDSSLMQRPTTAWTQQERVYFSLSPEQMELLLALGRGDYTMAFDPSKRDALRDIAAGFLAATVSSTSGSFATSDPEPWERLFLAQQASSASTLLNAATVEHFKKLLTISWQLCDQNQFAPAEGVLLSFLPQLLSLSRQEPGTASLASQGLRLQSIFAHHHLRLSDKVRLCEQAVNYALEAEDVNTLVTALMTLAVAYEYERQSDSQQKRLLTLQEALNHSHQASPLVQSRIYSHYAVALAESGRIREAELYIGLAQEVLPDDPTKDRGFTELGGDGLFTFSLHVGLVCIHAGSIPQAFPAFERYKQHPSGLVIPERFRLEIANGQSRAAIFANDAERYADLLEDVLVGSLRIGSQKRFDEALRIFRKEMPASWLSVSRIQQLSEQYGLKREE